MSTIAKKKNIFSILFSSEIDVDEYDYSDIKLPSELEVTLESINKKEENIKKGFNSGSNKSGIAAKVKINPKTEAAMRKKHEEVLKKAEDREER